jgi:hypothetical protein
MSRVSVVLVIVVFILSFSVVAIEEPGFSCTVGTINENLGDNIASIGCDLNFIGSSSGLGFVLQLPEQIGIGDVRAPGDFFLVPQLEENMYAYVSDNEMENPTFEILLNSRVGGNFNIGVSIQSFGDEEFVNPLLVEGVVVVETIPIEGEEIQVNDFNLECQDLVVVDFNNHPISDVICNLVANKDVSSLGFSLDLPGGIDLSFVNSNQEGEEIADFDNGAFGFLFEDLVSNPSFDIVLQSQDIGINHFNLRVETINGEELQNFVVPGSFTLSLPDGYVVEGVEVDRDQEDEAGSDGVVIGVELSKQEAVNQRLRFIFNNGLGIVQKAKVAGTIYCYMDDSCQEFGELEEVSGDQEDDEIIVAIEEILFDENDENKLINLVQLLREYYS